MSTKIAVGLALLLALAGWGLYRQVSANGELQEKLKQRQIELQQERGRVETLRLEIEERDQAVQRLQVRYDELNERKAKIRTVVRKVYVQPEVEEWAQTVPPASAATAVYAGIDCLWASGAEGGDANCGAVAAGGDDARL